METTAVPLSRRSMHGSRSWGKPPRPRCLTNGLPPLKAMRCLTTALANQQPTTNNQQPTTNNQEIYEKDFASLV
ncbi:MAG: hypothetical protein ACHBN1_06240 [Heteroscytonema crispum UTEX LB 1556]